MKRGDGGDASRRRPERYSSNGGVPELVLLIASAAIALTLICLWAYWH